MAYNRRENPYYRIKHSMPSVIGVCYTLISAVVSPNVHADDIAAIRFTSFEGFAEFRFREDEQTTSSGGPESTETRTSFEEQVFLLSHGYVYHPKFLKMDIGLGPVLIQSELENTTSGNNSDDTAEIDVLARLSFLEEKPYPLKLFYEKTNPSVSLTVTDRFQQQNEKYGFDFQLRQPLLPFKLALGASRYKTEGEGFRLITDDVIDQRTVRADIPIGVDGYATLTYNENDLTSNSGFITAPIETTEISTDTTSLDSRAYFGEKNQILLSNLLTYVEQESDVRPLKELRYTPELRWTHTKDLESFYRLSYLDSDQSDDQQTLETTNYGAATGLRYELSEKTSMNGDIHAEDNETTGQAIKSYGARANVSHKRDYSFGTLSLSGGWGYDYYDRVVSSNVPVDRIYDFVVSVPQFLPEENIVISTIVATRILSGGTEQPLDPVLPLGTACGTVVQVETYAVVVIGNRTQVQICAVTDGANEVQVRLRYEYDAGGTVEFTTLTQNYAANFRFYNVSNIYVRYRDRSADIQSGTPTQPLTESRNSQVGASVDYPLFNLMTLGGEVVYEEEEGTSISYDRESYDLYVQFRLFNGTTRIGGHQATVEYDTSSQFVDLSRLSMQFRIRPWNRFNLTAQLSDEEDTGSNPRRTKVRALNAEWRVRKLILLAETRFVEESYGSSNVRDRGTVRLTVRREF